MTANSSPVLGEVPKAEGYRGAIQVPQAEGYSGGVALKAHRALLALRDLRDLRDLKALRTLKVLSALLKPQKRAPTRDAPTAHKPRTCHFEQSEKSQLTFNFDNTV